MISKYDIAVVAFIIVMPTVLYADPGGVATDVVPGGDTNASDATNASVTGLGTAPIALSAKLRATDFSALWHPYFILFLLHCVNAAAAAVLSLKVPNVLIVIMLVGGLVWPISWISGESIWGYGPPGAEGVAGTSASLVIWWGCLIKWLIVSALATVPVLWLRANKATKKQINWLGIFVYFILGSNVLWTLGAAHEGHIVRFVNRATGIMLTISLILHCYALHKSNLNLFDVVDKGNGRFVYGNGTPFWWLVCYTVWNAFFIVEMTLGGTLQDFLFWVLMYVYKYSDPDQKQPIELYFAFARPVQLGSYIVFAEWAGCFFPYLKDAQTLKYSHPLPINSNAYFFFIVCMNFLFSLVCTYWSAVEIHEGIGEGKFRQMWKGSGLTELEDESSDSDKTEDS